MNKLHLKKLHKIVLGIIIFIAILLFAAPRAGRWYVVKHSQKLIGRKLEINTIRINYFSGTARVEGVKLYESDSKTIFMSLRQLKVNLDYIPLFRKEIFVKYITLDDPFVEVLQNGDKFNFSDLTASDKTNVVKKDTVPSEPMKYIINNIRINKGYVKYTDVALNHTIALNKLDLLIPGFTWNSESTNLDVNFRFVDGGGLYSKLALNQADSTYSINLKLDSLNLDIIEPYLQSYMRISALHGYLSNDIVIKGNMRSVMQLFIKGMNNIYGFQMLDTLNRTILSCKNISVDIDTLQLDKNRVKLNSVSLTDPFILFEMIDSTNNWFAIMKPLAPVQSDTLKPKSDTISGSSMGSYTFSKLQISGGKILFYDKTLRYPFEYTVDNIKLESTPVEGSQGKLNFKMTAGLNGSGTLAMNTTINPENYKDMDLMLEVGQFRMKDVDAYFRHYFGFPVTGGILHFKTDNKIRPESLISDNSIYFRKFTLEKSLKTKVEYHVPLRLALGILSDKDGIIDLKAPVESKGKETKIRNLGKIILKVIRNLFIKAAVSPFNLLASSYKIDPAALQEIRLNLFTPSPDEVNLKSVDIIADILTKKPALNIDFYYCVDRLKAIDSLAYTMALEDFIRNNKNTGVNTKNVSDSILINYIQSKSTSGASVSSQGLKNMCKNYIGTEKIEANYDSIKTLQINFITNYLSRDKAIAADRFRIVPIGPDTIRPLGNYPAFRAYFTDGGEKRNE
jgi:hypothetical protein